MTGVTDTTEAIDVGEVYCVAAHPYMRWTVVAVKAASHTAPNIVLRSAADPAVERTVALPVLQNPARFTRLAVS
jgi:hypothetical protein